MKGAYSEHTTLTGILYLHRISDPRVEGSSLKNLRLMRSLCGTENLSHVTLATTMWDMVTDEDGNRREKELKEDGEFWAQLEADGARIRRYDRTKEGALMLVNELLMLSPFVIQIQKEVAIEKKRLIDTAAGQSISEEITALTQEYQRELEEVESELEQTKKTPKPIIGPGHFAAAVFNKKIPAAERTAERAAEESQYTFSEYTMISC